MGDAAPPPNVITTRWGVSIAVVFTIVAGVVANLGMMTSIRERLATFENELVHHGLSMREMQKGLREFATNTRRTNAENAPSGLVRFAGVWTNRPSSRSIVAVLPPPGGTVR